jgi:hypothetical protein
MQIEFSLSMVDSGLSMVVPIEFSLAINNSTAMEFPGELFLYMAPAPFQYGRSVLPRITSFGGEITPGFGSGLSYFPKMFSSGEGGFYIPPAQVAGFSNLYSLYSQGMVKTSVPGAGQADIPTVISKGGTGGYGEGSATLPPLLSGGAQGATKSTAYCMSSMKAWHAFGVKSDTVIFIFESPTLTHSSSADRLARGELVSSGVVEGSATDTASRIVTVYNTGEVVEFYASDRLAQEQFIQDVVAAGGINPATIFNIAVNNALQVDGAIDALMSLLQALEEQAVIDGTATTLHDRLVEFFSYPSINDTSLPVKKSGGIWEIPGISESRTWAVSLDTGASSQYDGYGYNSFFERDGKYYGVADDGIYLLEGEKDAGKDIAALIDMGISDFGTFKIKKSAGASIGCSSSGPLVLHVSVDDNEQTYQMNSYSSTIKEHRIPVSHKQIGSEWGLKLTNSNGDDFDIAVIDLRLFSTNRRIK